MKLEQAMEIAGRVKAELSPHCYRIEIAGSVRRRKAEPKDIEIVCIPKQIEVGLFAGEFAPNYITAANQWQNIRGCSASRYTQRMLPEGIALDLFTATPENWGLTLATRTCSLLYSFNVLGAGRVRNGYYVVDGNLMRDGQIIPVPEERDLFRLAGVPWTEPENRG